MHESIRLGRIAGIDVGINWSVLVLGWLIAWSLAGTRFPESHPESSELAYWVVGSLTALLFLGSLLAHELAHSVVAVKSGVEVEGITLWLFGGMARLSIDASTADRQLRIAAVGPAASLAAAGFFFIVSLLLGLPAFDSVDELSLLASALAWLALMNLILAVFNLVPAAPLDGGRILRAIVWQRTGDPVRASVVASQAGRGFGYFLVVLGFLQFFAGAGLSGIWLVFLGWFLLAAAGAEGARAETQLVLGDTVVADAMTADPVVVPAFATAQQVVDQFIFRHRCSTFPVVDRDGRVTGLLTLNLIKQLPPSERANAVASSIARPIDEVVTTRPEEPLVDVIDRMSVSPDGRALVYSDGELVGIVSPTDTLRIMEARRLQPMG